MTGRRDAWTRVAVVSQPVLLLSSGLVVVAISQARSPTVVIGLVMLSVMALHWALHDSVRRAVRALGIASAAMVVLAVLSMPGWSTGVLLPSAGCFLLVSWRVVTTALPPWPVMTLAVGIFGVVRAESIAITRFADIGRATRATKNALTSV